MKKQMKKLELAKETVRRLDHLGLSRIAGASFHTEPAITDGSCQACTFDQCTGANYSAAFTCNCTYTDNVLKPQTTSC